MAVSKQKALMRFILGCEVGGCRQPYKVGEVTPFYYGECNQLCAVGMHIQVRSLHASSSSSCSNYPDINHFQSDRSCTL